MELKNLEVYRLACEISKGAWGIYAKLGWQDKKIMGDQFISAVDSVGVNIAERFGRFHYLDKNKFNYNARGSLFESIHWISLLAERGFMSQEQFLLLSGNLNTLAVKLNNLISSTKKQAQSK